MTKAIIFDTDGMVVITNMFSVKFCEEYQVSYEVVLPFFKNEFQPCLIGEADLKEQIKPYLEKWGWKKSVDDFLEYWFKAEHNIDKRVTDLIEKLRLVGVKCYLATNQEKYRTEYIRNQMGLGKIFDKIFSSAEVGFKKPQSEFFDKVMNEIGLEKNEVQFWDDTEKNVLGAKDFGIDARQYRNFEEFQKEMSSLLTES
ncbi:HAD-IA family hydrolase [Patescibacteria group bacterium]|nr:HAD-IA family hydrolase [Patescibacteria group bacterium]